MFSSCNLQKMDATNEYRSTSLPKGDRASFASRKCILPNGMPMMFPNVFIDLIGVLFVQAY